MRRSGCAALDSWGKASPRPISRAGSLEQADDAASRLRSSVRVEKGMEWFNCLMGWRLGSWWKRANKARAREPATEATVLEPQSQRQQSQSQRQTQEPDRRIQKRSQSQQRQHSQSKRASDRDTRARSTEPKQSQRQRQHSQSHRVIASDRDNRAGAIIRASDRDTRARARDRDNRARASDRDTRARVTNPKTELEPAETTHSEQESQRQR